MISPFMLETSNVGKKNLSYSEYEKKIRSKMTAHYPLTGSAVDLMGNYHGSMSSTGLFSSDVEKYAMLHSYEAAHCLDTLTHNELAPDDDNFSFSLVFKPTASKRQILVCKMDASSANTYGFLFYFTSENKFSIYSIPDINHTDIKYSMSEYSSLVDTYVHVVFSCDRKNGKFSVFINGTEIGMNNNNYPLSSYSSSTIPLILGANHWNTGTAYTSRLSNVRFFSDALTPLEAYELYVHDQLNNPLINTNGLLLYLPLMNSASIGNLSSLVISSDGGAISYNGRYTSFNLTGNKKGITLANTLSFNKSKHSLFSVFRNSNNGQLSILSFTNFCSLTIKLLDGKIIYNDGDTERIIGSTGDYNDGSFHSLAISKDGQKLLMYIDCKEVLNVSDSIQTIGTSSIDYSNNIGHHYDGSGFIETFNGDLAHLRIYDNVSFDKYYCNEISSYDKLNITDRTGGIKSFRLPEPPLLNHYKFNGDRKDSAGSLDLNNVSNFAYDSDVGSCISINNSGFLVSNPVMIIDNFSISFLIKTNQSNVGNYTIFARGDSHDAVTVVCRNQPDSYNGIYVTTNDTEVYSYEAGTNIADNIWHHVVITSDSIGVFDMYLDGVKHVPVTSSGGAFSSNNNMSIGRYLNGESAFIGFFKDFKIFNNKITDSDVKNIYENIKYGNKEFLVNDAEIYLPLDTNSTDYSGNDNQFNSSPAIYKYGKAVLDGTISISIYSQITKTIDKSNWFQCIWFKTSTSGTYPVIMSLANGIESTIRLRNDSNYACSFYDGHSNTKSSEINLNDNIWHHVCIGKRAGISEVWIDGKLSAKDTTSIDCSTNSNVKSVLGAYGSVDLFDGSLAFARLYLRPLSTKEIESIYNDEYDKIQYYEV